MSAIFGVIYKRDASAISDDIVSMQAALMHRASDGKAVWHSDRAFIGHHQLCIHPEQAYEQMPFEDGDLVIAADASIHNREDLFTRLGIEKGQQTTYPDSMLVLAAYKKWGESCPEYLDGEFAFVVYNKVSGTLFCAVDQIGFQPLYYYDASDAFVFSSEIKGIIAVKKTPNVFNEEALIEYYFRQSDKRRTYTKDVFALCGGNKLIVKEGKPNVSKYWEPGVKGKYHFTKSADWAACLRELMIKAVEDRMRTDLPVGVTLSGGLDSSSIACIAGKILEQRNKPLYAFSSVLSTGYKGNAVDERGYIAVVGKYLKNLDQTFVEAPAAGLFSGVEESIYADEGIPNGFFYIDQAIDQAAKKKGIKVLMSGYGGDFFVSWKGNSVIYQLLKQFRFGKAAEIFAATQKYEQQSLKQLLKTELIAHTDLYDRIAPFLHRNKRNWNKQTTLKDDYFNKYREQLIFKNEPDQIAYMTRQIGGGHTGRLCSMFINRDAAYGMSSALPLFDRRIMDFMFDVPLTEFRTEGTRRSIIRNAMEGILPPEIQWRRDKLPYSPNYISRLQESKQFINAIINTEELNFVWEYVDRKSIIDNIDNLKESAGMGRVSEIAGIRILQGVICIIFLRWLIDNNYSFDK